MIPEAWLGTARTLDPVRFVEGNVGRPGRRCGYGFLKPIFHFTEAPKQRDAAGAILLLFSSLGAFEHIGREGLRTLPRRLACFARIGERRAATP